MTTAPSPLMTSAAPGTVTVEYPAPMESVPAHRCIVQVSAPADAACVEVRVDAGPWQECHRACGFWWHDADGFAPGERRLYARALLRGGGAANAVPVRFTAVAYRGK